MHKRLLIPISTKSLNSNGIPFSPATWRKWHHLNKYPEIVIKVAGRLFINFEKWAELVDLAGGGGQKNVDK